MIVVVVCCFAVGLLVVLLFVGCLIVIVGCSQKTILLFVVGLFFRFVVNCIVVCLL